MMKVNFSISLTIAGHLLETRDFSIQKAFFDRIGAEPRKTAASSP
jgi:hypothetical protein